MTTEYHNTEQPDNSFEDTDILLTLTDDTESDDYTDIDDSNSVSSLTNLFNEDNIQENGIYQEKNQIDCDLTPKRTGLMSLIIVLYSIPLRLIYIFYIGPIQGIFNMMESGINALLVLCSTYLGISQQRINSKFIKQFFVIGLLVVVFVQSRNDDVRSTIKTKGLFPKYSLVCDFIYGEFNLLREEIENSDIAVVMYYAPWDRQSQDFVSHFLRTAQYHHEQVTFSAINCWLPKSECQTNFRFHQYPLIVLYVKATTLQDSLAIPYNGPLSSYHLIRFISNAIRPFIHISDKSKLLEVQMQYEAVVLGYFDSNHFRRDFLSFYFAAINKLQFEHLSEVKFALVTDDALANYFTLTKPSGIQLRTRKKIIAFPNNASKNLKNITKFVNMNFSPSFHWLTVNSKKSLAVNKLFQRGPFLVIFAPDNPFHESNDLFQMGKSLALQYLNCDAYSRKQEAILYERERKNLIVSRQICKEFIMSMFASKPDFKYQSEESDFQDTCKNQKFPPLFSFNFGSWLDHSDWVNLRDSMEADLLSSGRVHCRKDNFSQLFNTKSEYFGSNYSRKEEDQIFEPQPFFGGYVRDDKVHRMMELAKEDRCKRLVLGSSLSDPLIVNESVESARINGLGCSTNRTLQFVAIDSLRHKDLAEQFGVKLTKSSKFTGSVIVDAQNEEIYVLDRPISGASLTAFIFNYTNNLLDRGKRSTKVSVSENNIDGEQIWIQEMDAHSYLQTVNKKNKSSLVLHYSHHCGACGAIGNVLLSIKRLLSNASNIVFGRIDVSKNTLPWHLTFHSVPTIIFHPHHAKSESKVFDPRLPITMKNLIAFILPHLRVAERSAAASNICNSDCIKSVSSQSLVEKLKLHHRLHALESKVEEYEAYLYSLAKHPSSNSNHMKFHIILALKSSSSRKILATKAQIIHVDRVLQRLRSVP